MSQRTGNVKAPSTERESTERDLPPQPVAATSFTAKAAVGLARLMAASHLAYIVFLIFGGFLARRWPKLMWWHLGAFAGAGAVNFTKSDCPFTVWEKWFLRRAGREPYESGFISNYLVEPIYRPGINGRVNAVILATLFVPNVLSYRRLLRAASRRR